MEDSKNGEPNTTNNNTDQKPTENGSAAHNGEQNGKQADGETKKVDPTLDFEIVNEDYKNIKAEVKEKAEDEEDEKEDKDKKKKKKKKQKKKDKKDESDDEGKDPGASKKIKKPVSAYDNQNIPAELRQKYGDYEKNPLCVAVANIPLGISLTELKGYFTTLLSSLKADAPNPIRHIEIGSTKNFAILELDTKELAQFCYTLDNLELQNYKLKIERPKGFFNKVYDAEAEGRDPFGNISTNAAQDDQRIYMGSIPLYLREEDVRKLCESFGVLRFFNLVKDSEGGHKGYCFFEYTDPKCANEAVKRLDGLEIGDKRLKVQKVATTTTVPALVPKADKEAPRPTNAGGSFLLGFPNISDPNVQTMLNVPFSARTPSRVIQLLNMCTVEDLMEDEYYRELREDVMEECSKFGPVSEIDIPRPDPKTGIAGPSVGKIFVKFQYLIPAKQARYRLAGRTYDRRTVITSFYPEDKYDAKEYLYNPY